MTGSARGDALRAPVGQGRAPAWWLSVAVLLAMVAAAAAGLFVEGLYQEPISLVAMLRAYDLVTLVVVVPLLALSLLPSVRASAAAHLLWMSMLAYAVYAYAYYVFGTGFNDAFLLHVAVFSLAVFAFALAMAGTNASAIASRFSPRTPVRSIAAVFAVLAVGLGGVWIYQSLRFAVTGDAPQESLLVTPAASVHLAYVLDLALLVPGYALAAVLLWRRAPWGYVLAGVLLPFNVIYQVNYLTALAFQTRARVPGASAFDPQEVPVLAVLVIATVLLFGSLRSRRRRSGRLGNQKAG
jgi:hypothetical protein